MVTDGTAAENAATAPRTNTVATRRLLRVTGVAGLATIVLLFGPAFIAFPEEPTFDAPAAEILAYLQSADSPLAESGRFVFTVGLVVLLWFVVGITSLLRRVEEEPPWRSTIALASGAMLVAVALATKPDAVPSRSDDLDPQIAQLAFDQGNVSFANTWVALGSFTICCRRSI